MYDYTKLTFTELVAKIGKSRFFHLPKMLEEILGRLVPQAPRYKGYTALLTQSGTDAPVATVLENTLGDVVWNRTNLGEYEGTILNAFTLNKTFSFLGQINDGDTNTTTYKANLYRIDSSTVRICTVDMATATSSDELLRGTEVEIRVYN